MQLHEVLRARKDFFYSSFKYFKLKALMHLHYAIDASFLINLAHLQSNDLWCVGY